MAMASVVKVVLGSIAFGFFWVLAVFPAVPFLPIGRTAGSLLGAMLMVIFRVISPEDAYAAIDLPILGLLFGTMVVSIFLEKADMFKHLGTLLSWRCAGGKDLLVRTCVASAVSSALFTNDTCCVVLTEFILKLARQNNLPPQPFLLALASSSNIGSAATPIGNPQNLVIALQSGISFEKFLIGLFPAVLVGGALNAAILLGYFWKALSTDHKVDDEEVPSAAAVITGGGEAAAEGDVTSHRFSPATMSHVTGEVAHINRVREETDVDGFAEREETAPASEAHSKFKEEDTMDTWKTKLWKICVYLVTIGMLIALLMGLNMSWSAITAALVLVVLDFKDACPCLDKVSYSLLIFFCGMFITVDGFNKTGLPSELWEFVEPYSRIDRASGLALLSLVIIVLSNVASNVPTVLLLGGRIAASAALISAVEETRAWLILAWVSTVAGNLSLLGSAANLIVCEQARRAQPFGYNLSFFSHLRFGFPSTIVVTAVGLLFLN
ncbi:hypothetical protein Cni_G19440 [Canna indica]|uniref:Citrate transporter-like domain-containing protein n=1 Tax=Canna indica TaxID=4628 RepID=A0AAQ3QII9_9LILI|nr:hypothetical protein Cni_G19440 [Canna indica]